jgi:Skp family chaperone for outer membrane proteins
MSRILLAALAALSATPALAQTAAPPASAGLGGPLIPGVCLLSEQAVFLNAKVGMAATARLTQLGGQAKAEMDAERAPLASEEETLRSDAAALKPADVQQRAQALQARETAYQQKVALRNRELEATRQKVIERIMSEAQSVIAQAYKAHNCGLILDRNSVLGGNMGGDLTPDVVRGLDAKITTITFDRESLAQAAAPPPIQTIAPPARR